jgi:hypothetical protein
VRDSLSHPQVDASEILLHDVAELYWQKNARIVLLLFLPIKQE